MYIYSSLAHKSLFLYLCYLRISCPFPFLHDWVDKWLINSFPYLLSLSLSLYQYTSFLPIHPQHETTEGNSFGDTPLGANSLLLVLVYPPCPSIRETCTSYRRLNWCGLHNASIKGSGPDNRHDIVSYTKTKQAPL